VGLAVEAFKERFEAIAPSWRNFSGLCAFVPIDPIFGPNEYPANSRIGSPALGQGVAQRSFAPRRAGARQYIESKFARRHAVIIAYVETTPSPATSSTFQGSRGCAAWTYSADGIAALRRREGP
jgi:hypothetical protein